MWSERWDSTRKLCDANDDGRISVGEWFMARERLYHAEAPADRRSNGTLFEPIESRPTVSSLMFEALDRSGNGLISHEEFLQHLKLLQIDVGPNAAMILRLVFGDKKSLTAKDFQRLAREYTLSDDPLSPGNWWCGII